MAPLKTIFYVDINFSYFIFRTCSTFLWNTTWSLGLRTIALHHPSRYITGASLSMGVARNWLGGEAIDAVRLSHNLLHYRQRITPPRPVPRRRGCNIFAFSSFLWSRRAMSVPRMCRPFAFSPAQQVKTFIIVDAARRPARRSRLLRVMNVLGGAPHTGRYKGRKWWPRRALWKSFIK